MVDILLPLVSSVVLAVVVGLMGWLGARESLPRNAVFGIRTSSTTASEQAWSAAHKAAAPYSYGSAAVFVVGSIASAVVGTTENQRVILLLGGIALGMIVLCLGARTATEVAKATTSGQM